MWVLYNFICRASRVQRTNWEFWEFKSWCWFVFCFSVTRADISTYFIFKPSRQNRIIHYTLLFSFYTPLYVFMSFFFLLSVYYFTRSFWIELYFFYWMRLMIFGLLWFSCFKLCVRSGYCRLYQYRHVPFSFIHGCSGQRWRSWRVSEWLLALYLQTKYIYTICFFFFQKLSA